LNSAQKFEEPRIGPLYWNNDDKEILNFVLFLPNGLGLFVLTITR
jgi:hypothetical protein